MSYNIPDVKEEPAFDLKVSLKRSDDVIGPIVATETGEPLCLPLDVSINTRQECDGLIVIRGPFLENPGIFSGP